MQRSTCVNWRHARHVITAKTTNGLLSFMSENVRSLSLRKSFSEQDRICTVQNFAVLGDIVKLSRSKENRVRDVAVYLTVMRR